MPSDQRIADDERSLDVFEDAADDKDDQPNLASDPVPTGLADARAQRTDDARDDSDADRPTRGDSNDLPDATVKEAAGEEGDILTADDDLALDGVDEVQAAEPEPTLNLPDDATEDDDELDYAGPTEPLTFSNKAGESPGDELQYSGPDLDLNLSDEENEEEPVPSVSEGESGEVVVFDAEANQGYPVDSDDDEAGDELAEPTIPVPSDTGDDYPDFTQTPDLPQIEAFPEPPNELEYNPNPPYDLTFDDSDDEDDDMGDG